MTILVDADACPVTSIVIKIARERGSHAELMKAEGFYTLFLAYPERHGI